MKLILREDVSSLGKSGDVVSVKPGFGRNFLLPRKLAVLASDKNVRQLEHHKQVIAGAEAKRRAAAETQVKALAGLKVKISRKVGEQDKLFGSVTASNIAEALNAQGQTVEHRQIVLAEPIKALGSYDVQLKLHRDVSGTVKVEVVPEV